MRIQQIVILFCALVVLALCAGCAQNAPGGTTPQTTTAPRTTLPLTIPGGLSLTPSPTVTLPAGAGLSFQVMNGPSLIHPTAQVYFQGGAGQSQVQTIEVTLITEDGQFSTKTLVPKVGSYVEFPVTRGLYRVIIKVTLTNGVQYVIWDKTEDYNSHA